MPDEKEQIGTGMRDQNEQYAYFSLHGDFDPHELSAGMRLEPSQCWKKGDRAENRSHVRVFSRWSLVSSLDKSEPLKAHIRSVLAQLEGREDAVREYSRQFGGTMQLVGYFWQEYPGLHFEPELVSKIAGYGLAIDFDFYGLYSHRREDTGYTLEK